MALPARQRLPPSRLRQRRQIEGLGWPEPQDVLGVVLDIVAGVGVRKDCQALAVFQKPGDDLSEEVGLEGELTAAPWMRADRVVVHTPNDKGESLPSRGTQRLSLPLAAGVIINVGMVAVNCAQPRTPRRIAMFLADGKIRKLSKS
jgi:hypothetical protein